MFIPKSKLRIPQVTLGEKYWVMHHNKPVEAVVVRVALTKSVSGTLGTGRPHVNLIPFISVLELSVFTNLLSGPEGGVFDSSFHVDELDLYSTKEELIASL